MRSFPEKVDDLNLLLSASKLGVESHRSLDPHDGKRDPAATAREYGARLGCEYSLMQVPCRLHAL